MPVLLSFIIPVYNSELYLDGCLNSIYRAGVDETLFQVVLVNDGSPDCSAQVCLAWAAQHANIVYLEQVNRGASTARNTGLAAATGDWVWFVDSDDKLEGSFFVKVMQQLSEPYDVLSFNYCKEDASGVVPAISCHETQEMNGIAYLLQDRDTYLWSKIFRRKLLQFPFLDGTKNIEDLYFCVKNMVHAQRVCCCPDVGYRYNCENQLSTSRNLKKRNLIKLTQDTLCIQRNLMQDLKGETSPEIREVLQNELTKITAGHLFSLLRFYSNTRINRVVRLYREWGIYPIRHKTKNKKMNQFIFWANSTFRLKLMWWLMRLKNRLI